MTIFLKSGNIFQIRKNFSNMRKKNSNSWKYFEIKEHILQKDFFKFMNCLKLHAHWFSNLWTVFEITKNQI